MTKKTSPAYRASKEETIPINKLHPFSNHPFHIRHDLEFSELVDSISESGIITPIIVRPKVGVGYEVISGHRRWEACKELGIESIPARVEYIDDDEATILMVNSNIQREHVLPSEKAFAYKMRMEAMKHQGKATSSQLGTKLRTLDAMGKYEYFYGAQAEQFSFYRIPKALFTEPNFRELSTDAKVLYGILLDRMSLSLKNQWLDAQNKVYIIFTVEEIMDALNCANQKATRLMVELEKQAGLIERKRQGLGRPNLIYVKNFAATINSKSCEKGDS